MKDTNGVCKKGHLKFPEFRPKYNLTCGFFAYSSICVPDTGHRQRGWAWFNGQIWVAFMAGKQREDTVLEAKRAKTKPPPMYKVMILNDDYTPMDFVVIVLQKFFALTREKATQIMLKVHREGMGVCGVYSKDVAATKVDQVRGYAKQHQHPLQCMMEEN